MGFIDRWLGIDGEPLDMENERQKSTHDEAGWERVERYERGEIDRAGREIDEHYDPADYADEWIARTEHGQERRQARRLGPLGRQLLGTP